MAGIKINGDTSGSTTITAPNTGTDETIELSTALASKLDASSTTRTLLRVVDTNSVASVSIDNIFDGSYLQYRAELRVRASSPSVLFLTPRSGSSDTVSSGWWREVRDRQNAWAESRSGVISASAITLDMSVRNVHEGADFDFLVGHSNTVSASAARYIAWTGYGQAFAGFRTDGMMACDTQNMTGIRLSVTGAGVTFSEFYCAIYGVNMETYP